MIFEKGHIPWHKGKKTGIVPKSAFKKGNKSYRFYTLQEAINFKKIL